MGAKTRIDWCDTTWNPVTGCRHRCEYCYAQRIARRFCGKGSFDPKSLTVTNGIFELEKPALKSDGKTIAPYPFAFDPTFHRYKLDEPQRWKKPRSIFVCSMADLFGEWVPDEWILEVLLACRRAPQHRYVFLTKNPRRYDELSGRYDFFREIWLEQYFGATATNNAQLEEASNSIATWLSIEPILEPVYKKYLFENWSGVIIGAETGTRKNKVIPEKAWIMDIVEACKYMGTPVFMKESLRGIVGEDFVQELPWRKSR